jgi:hypothetical protein
MIAQDSTPSDLSIWASEKIEALTAQSTKALKKRAKGKSRLKAHDQRTAPRQSVKERPSQSQKKER